MQCHKSAQLAQADSTFLLGILPLNCAFATRCTNATVHLHCAIALCGRPAPPPVYLDGVEVCRRYNKGLCETPCPNNRKHVCIECRGYGHKAYACRAPGGGDAGNGYHQDGRDFRSRSQQNPTSAQARPSINQPSSGAALGRPSGRSS
jgi:hypothetical protein